MRISIKKAVSTTFSLLLMTGLSVCGVNAQQTVSKEAVNHVVVNESVDHVVVNEEPLDQAQLDQVLAPIALYPDSLLSHILVASTYPLEVVQANRWRQSNQELSEEKVIDALEEKDWDPSVKALAPFTDLLFRLSKDLDWLQQLGDSFLQNENQVLASVQYLRQKAYEKGSLANNDYYSVQSDNGNIVIEPTDKEVVYVPYYDSRVVYGSGWRGGYEPVYWSRPRYSRLHAGFYWSDRFYIRPTIFYGGFHWGSRNLVVNHHVYNRSSRFNRRYRNVGVSDYRRWNHNPRHRRGARYTRNGNQRYRNRTRYITDPKESRYSRDRVRNERRADNRRTAQNRDRNRTRVQERIRNQNRGKDSSIKNERRRAKDTGGRTQVYSKINNRNKAKSERYSRSKGSNANKSSNRYTRTSAANKHQKPAKQSSRYKQKQQTKQAKSSNSDSQKSSKSSRNQVNAKIKKARTSHKSSNSRSKRNYR